MKSIKLVNHRFDYANEIHTLSSATPVKEALGLPDGTVEDTKQFIKMRLEEEFAGKTVPRVILNEDFELIGLTDLMFIDYPKKSCHIGTWIGHPYWGKGYNEASKIAILQIAFKELGLDYVFAGARQTNIRSQKAQEKLPYIRLNVESEFPEEHAALEKKEKQPCLLNVFCKNDFFSYMNTATK
ncbi:GNAT family N-acetyltransferase [Planococcus sp. N028]|uniref:GNAT family N-acetyltransferase n=1 Tax=Planococcus shixiaomingii TaxID=3058393 RepID=A0ABT8MYR7_9BACL|nr:GNAT family N-acetyltransferase [Planococcus sp. N028]MDN7240753.1 GNAT family N-acetyltransferase [Planococcus sp. N028]